MKNKKESAPPSPKRLAIVTQQRNAQRAHVSQRHGAQAQEQAEHSQLVSRLLSHMPTWTQPRQPPRHQQQMASFQRQQQQQQQVMQQQLQHEHQQQKQEDYCVVNWPVVQKPSNLIEPIPYSASGSAIRNSNDSNNDNSNIILYIANEENDSEFYEPLRFITDKPVAMEYYYPTESPASTASSSSHNNSNQNSNAANIPSNNSQHMINIPVSPPNTNYTATATLNCYSTNPFGNIDTSSVQSPNPYALPEDTSLPFDADADFNMHAVIGDLFSNSYSNTLQTDELAMNASAESAASSSTSSMSTTTTSSEAALLQTDDMLMADYESLLGTCWATDVMNAAEDLVEL